MWMIIPLLAVLGFSSPALAQQACISSAPQVVDDVYQQVLERPADPSSAELTQALASGRMSVRDVVATVSKSPEYDARFFWPPMIAAVYRQVMQRPPTAAEVRMGASSLASGDMTPSSFVAHIATRAANNRPDAIQIVYRRLLGRDPDPNGLHAYTEVAQRDGLEAVAQSIVSSPEYRNRATHGGIPLEGAPAYEDAVRLMYRRLLGRDADAEGLRALAEVASVYGAKGAVDRMLGSAEYGQRYGDNGIPGSRDMMFCGTPFGRRTTRQRP